MKSSIVILVAVIACFYKAEQVTGASAACDLVSSTAKIVGRLCFGDDGKNKENQPLIDEFFGCYDKAPGKQQFVNCQTEIFGGPLDNIRTVTKTCTTQGNLVPYGGCLRKEFRNAGLDMLSTVMTLNACQAKIFGIDD